MRAAGTILVVLATILTAAPAASADLRTKWTGRFACNSGGQQVPLADAKVELWERGVDELPKWLTDSLISVKRTGPDGEWEFNTRSEDEDDFYIRILLTNDDIDVNEFPWPWPYFADTDSNQNDKAVQEYRTQLVPGPCDVFLGMDEAYGDYVATMGTRPPYGDLTVLWGGPNAGVPLAPYSQVIWPRGYPAGDTARHEFGHTFRHVFDGPFSHWLLDVGFFEYAQQHRWCKQTNSGFAFNEGWANWWARINRDEVCGGNPDNHTYEGNVTRALYRLEGICLGLDRRSMVDVLRRNPGRIHSYDDYRAAIGDCVTTTKPPPGFSLETDVRPKSGGAWSTALARERTALARQARSVTRELAEARRDRNRECGQPPCPGALADRLAVPLLAGTLQQLRARQAVLAEQLTPAARRDAAGPPDRSFTRRVLDADRRVQAAMARIGKSSFARALAAARPILRRDRSAQARTLGKRLRTLRRGFARGALPAGFAPTDPTSASTRTLPDLPATANFDDLSAGSVIGTVPGLRFGTLEQIAFPGPPPPYVCSQPPAATATPGFAASPPNAALSATCPIEDGFHVTGMLARLTRPASEVSAAIGGSVTTRSGYAMDIELFDGAGRSVGTNAEVTTSEGEPPGARERLTTTGRAPATFVAFYPIGVTTAPEQRVVIDDIRIIPAR